MKIIKSKFANVKVAILDLNKDSRGVFFEIFNKNKYKKYPLIEKSFAQSNISISKKNVLRGLHYQIKYPQSQLVTIIEGELFYVIVDVRLNSKTFLKWESFELSSKKINQIFNAAFNHFFIWALIKSNFFFKIFFT